MSFDKYDIVQPDHDKEKGAAQGRLPEPEAKCSSPKELNSFNNYINAP